MQALTGGSIGYAADLWSLGCVLFQMLVGTPPFRAASEYLTLQRVAAAEYSAPKGLDPPAADLIRKLLLLDPEQRLGAIQRFLYQSTTVPCCTVPRSLKLRNSLPAKS